MPTQANESDTNHGGVPAFVSAENRDVPDPVQRRKAIVDLYMEGWSVTSIAGYLETTRTRVYETLARWEAEGSALRAFPVGASKRTEPPVVDRGLGRGCLCGCAAQDCRPSLLGAV